MLQANELQYGPPGASSLGEPLSFTLKKGGVLLVQGENGTGKSLLARTMMGLLPAKGGLVENTFSRIRYLPQMQNRAAHLPFTLGEVIDTGHGSYSLLEAEKLALAWNQASGGERQRALLTRFFREEGELLVLDEPFNHLDQASQGKVKEKLRELLEGGQHAMILITHGEDPASWLGVPFERLILGSA